ncbi:CD226 antigen, partial [Austrofundulus limnaeus]|uniref:CD226 antigen n=1 Tax=Austrofundulus limnaeus TaxID=52670 RepID=A0A2I4AIW0_AUSLI
MSALSVFLLVVSLLMVVSADEIISAETGQNITLPCRAPNKKPVVVVEWDRTDLGSDHVLKFRDDDIYPDVQHPSFKNRVDLQDRQMKDGDVSLVLKNVTTTDNGTYVCRLVYSQTKRSRRNHQEHDYITKYYLQVVTPDHNITAEPGDTITLSCRAPDSRPVVVVQWDRTDLEPQNVLLFRDDQINPDGQHPSFKNRTDLQDREMKDGDVSLVLRKVTTADSGTYVCGVTFSQTKRRKRSVPKYDPLSTIHLQVSPPGELCVCVCVCVCVC